MMRLYAILTGIFLSIMITGCSSSKGLTKEEKAALREAIESREYTVDVDRMLPMSGRSQALTSSYSLEIKGNRVRSYLPYYGRAYSVPYGGGDGLNFESEITGYESSFDTKGQATVEFETKTKEDLCRFRLEIFPDGQTSIHVTSVNRQAISFHGTATGKKNR
jgi:hypothetical protein